VSNPLFETGTGTRIKETGLETTRYEYWGIAIREMWNYPWGGRLIKLNDGYYVHNLWLDQLGDASLISMVLLLFFHFAQVYFWAKLIVLNINDYYKIFFSVHLLLF